jgi:hypothetical protein
MNKLNPKKVVPPILGVILLGLGLNYTNCGSSLETSSLGTGEPALQGSTTQEGQRTQTLAEGTYQVVLKDGTKLSLVKPTMEKYAFVLKDGTKFIVSAPSLQK